MTYQNIIFEVEENIGMITFNRPKALNALNNELLEEFSTALDLIAKDENIKVLILTGAGDKAFVAGADIRELATFNPLQAKLFAGKGQRVLSRLQELAVPVIAAVNGFALGGGFEMALASDFIYAANTARFGLPEINLGLIPGFGGTQRLARLIGKNMAKEMIFTGMMLSADQAAEKGIVNKVCPPAELMSAVRTTASGMAAKGRVALRAAKETINKGFETDLVTGNAIECDAFALCMASPDAKEGTNAFLEKRKSEFTSSLTD